MNSNRLAAFLCDHSVFRFNSCKKSFQEEFVYDDNQPEVQDRIVDMAMNGSGIRDSSRVLVISQDTAFVSLDG
ncbi:IS1-like element transposase [Spongorhabdus nitratireducens]